MPRPHRYTDDHVPSGHVFEFMLKCVGGTHLLRPDDEINEIIVGELAYALGGFSDRVRFHELVCQSNHQHGLFSASCEEVIEDFMEAFAGNLAVKTGRVRGWEGRVWNARYSLTQIFPSAQRVRQRYLWAQGLPENLYASPSDNPCVSSFHAWSTGERHLDGVWYDGTAMCKDGVGWDDRAARQPYGRAMRVTLHPLPIDEGRSKPELVAQARTAAKILIELHKQRRAEEGVGVLGAAKMRAASPFDRPAHTKRGRAAPLALGTQAEVAAFEARHAAAAETRDAVLRRLVRHPATSDYPERAAMPSVLRKAIRHVNELDELRADKLRRDGRVADAEAVLAASPRRRPHPTLPEAAPIPRGARRKKRRAVTAKRKKRPTPRADRLRRRRHALLRVSRERRRRVTHRLRTDGQRRLAPRVVQVPAVAVVTAGPRTLRLLIRPAVDAAADEDPSDAPSAPTALIRSRL